MRNISYPYIRAWGKFMGSHDYYIDAEVRRAEESGAPQNAIFQNGDKSWSTFDQIANSHTRQWIQQTVNQIIGQQQEVPSGNQ